MGDCNLLSLRVARKQIWPMEGLLATGVCTPVGSLWVVVQFVTSPVLGAGEDLKYKLGSQLRFAQTYMDEHIPYCNRDTRRHVRAFPSSPC